MKKKTKIKINNSPLAIPCPIVKIEEKTASKYKNNRKRENQNLI